MVQVDTWMYFTFARIQSHSLTHFIHEQTYYMQTWVLGFPIKYN